MTPTRFDVRASDSFRGRGDVTLAELRLNYQLKAAERELAAMRAAKALPETDVERQ